MSKHLRVAITVAMALLWGGCRGHHWGPGEVTRKAVPEKVVAQRAAAERTALDAVAPGAGREAKQILFGDLHVHTTFSADAFMRSLPFLQGEGAHPPADACDFARYCSGLDFWSINDHAEAISPQHWKETKESIRECNAAAGDPGNPDLVAFLGWEWTQVGQTPADHYGHKNVIFRDTAEDKVPTRPISALSPRLVGALRKSPPLWQRLMFPIFDFEHRQTYFDFAYYQQQLRNTPLCPEGVDVHELPEDCHESAQTPRELFEKLDQWGFDTLVIPHGTTWGFYTPMGVTFDKQLTAAQNDPQRQRLIEVYSGHGNSEEYRDWRAIEYDAKGNPVCPAPRPNYLPCCWQAGEIIRSRCVNTTPEECERRVEEARQNYLKAGVAGNQTVVGATLDDWKDCGVCRDCFNPAYKMRPGDSVQYATAITNLDDPNDPRRFHFGFIASSDNHSARPGTGFKEFGRHWMTETAGPATEAWRERILGAPKEPAPESRRFDMDQPGLNPFQVLDLERQASFFMTGGLVAVHSAGRDRDSIWNALKRREVYGTSGSRILLWFDLLNAPGGPQPMGSVVHLEGAPQFRVRAVGSFEQKPGCPEHSLNALGRERLHYICKDECYNPSDVRRRITRIEVVRIEAQKRKNEPVGPLIQDPWRKIECPDNREGCQVEFSDPDFPSLGREVAYYVRAIQEPTEAVNAGGLRCDYDSEGNCIKVHPCYGDYRTPFDDDCLTKNEERAWSSPIYVSE